MKNKNILRSSRIVIEPSDGEDLWNADWVISLAKGDKAQIGKASFAGEKELGAVPLEMELKEAYRNQGYGTEAICMMVSWAFRHSNIYEVKAVADHENDKAVKALGKAGFIYRGGDRLAQQYSIKKEKSNWTGIYLVIGVIQGLFLGIILSNMLLGLAVGLAVCLAIGIIMDNAEKHRRDGVVHEGTDRMKKGE